MALTMTCDDCGKVLRDKPDLVNKDNTNWKPDARAKLSLTIEQEGTGKSWPVDMDLCIKCAGKYLRVLREPI